MSFRIAFPGRQPIIDKAPAASLRYGVDVAGLLGEGDSIASVEIAGSEGVDATGATHSGTVVSARISGGTAGEVGSVTLRWSTSQGDTDERTLQFNVVAR